MSRDSVCKAQEALDKGRGVGCDETLAYFLENMKKRTRGVMCIGSKYS